MIVPIEVRAGRDADGAGVLALWDAAIAWLVGRGQAEQWGVEPASSNPRRLAQMQGWLSNSTLRVAELDGEPVGASVLSDSHPSYVPSTGLDERYLGFLLSDRRHAGCGIGAQLVRHAAQETEAAGCEVLRVDCWAGSPKLVDWYERQGFTRSGTFAVGDGWRGQVFEMRL